MPTSVDSRLLKTLSEMATRQITNSEITECALTYRKLPTVHQVEVLMRYPNARTRVVLISFSETGRILAHSGIMFDTWVDPGISINYI